MQNTAQNQDLEAASVAANKPNPPHEQANIQSGLLGAGFWAKYGHIYEGGYRSERAAIRAVQKRLNRLYGKCEASQ